MGATSEGRERREGKWPTYKGREERGLVLRGTEAGLGREVE